MGTSASDYNDERAKEFAEKASEKSKKHKEHKAEWDAKMAEMKSKRTLTLVEEQQKAFEERQRKALEIQARVEARKNKNK